MSEKVPNMLDSTISKIRELVDGNSVIGDPIVTSDGATIIPVTNVSVGFGGGGSDFATKNSNQSNAFGGGIAGGVKVTPVAFLVIREGNIRMIPVPTPANTTADRLLEMLPDTLDKIGEFIDSHTKKKDA